MFRPSLLFSVLIVSYCTNLYGAETGRILELAKVDFRLAYDCLPALGTTADGLIASKRDSANQEEPSPEPVLAEVAAPTNSPPNELTFAAPVDAGSVGLRPVATGKAPALGLFRTRISSRYTSGAWLDVRSGYGDVLVEDRVGRVQMNGAGIQDPNFLYLKVCLKF